MSNRRSGTPGATRECPHCKESILESASVCPACRHHLRFDESGRTASAPDAFNALAVEGTLRHPVDAPAWEYNVVVSIRNDRGEEIARRVIGVGAISATEERTFSLSVEVTPVDGQRSGRSKTRH